MTKGRIHSIESMGLVDGPGIRSIVFIQGCHLRCSYCHNPDTWSTCGGKEVTPEEVVNKIKRFKSYFDKSGGGVTFSGGDPLIQPEFLLECLQLCKEAGIHTTIDTAGYGEGNYEEILKYTDLVLLDIKQEDSKSYKELTGKDTKGINLFLDALRRSNSRVWVRHVVVPGITDSEEHILKLAKIIKEEIPNVDKIELLPYHNIGAHKYESLGIPYRLSNIKPMDKNRCFELQDLIRKETGIL